MALSPATAAFIARLRSAVEGVAKAKGLRAHVDHRVNVQGELVVALLARGECDPSVYEAVRVGLEALALKHGDGVRVATRSRARTGDVIALVLPPRVPGQWGSAAPAERLYYPWSQQCLTCHALIRAPDFLAILALGWVPESAHLDAASSGWFCGKCASAPPSPPPKRSRRRC